jgi:hypothetical protein
LTSTHRVTALLRDNPALIDARDDEGRPLVSSLNPEAPAPHSLDSLERADLANRRLLSRPPSVLVSEAVGSRHSVQI